METAVTSRFGPGRASRVAGAVHLVAVLLTNAYVENTSEGQAALVWVLFDILDYPISTPYLIPDELARVSWARQIYWPPWIHGVAGTLWWMALVYLGMAILKKWRAKRIT